MIKLKQITTVLGEVTLIFEADGFPDGARQIRIPLSEIEDRLKVVNQVLGREPTINDYKNAVKKLVADLRLGKAALPSRPDFSSLIGVDLEEGEAQ